MVKNMFLVGTMTWESVVEALLVGSFASLHAVTARVHMVPSRHLNEIYARGLSVILSEQLFFFFPPISNIFCFSRYCQSGLSFRVAAASFWLKFKKKKIQHGSMSVL